MGELPPARRFPPPWSVEDIGAAFVVKDSGAQKLGRGERANELSMGLGIAPAPHLCLLTGLI
jgi:hypothetical protein